MNFQGASFYILGDSLSLPGVTPGMVLASWLKDNGASVTVDAVGGWALSYWRPGVKNSKWGKRSMEMLDRALHSGADHILVMLGTNDYAQSYPNILDGVLVLHRFLGKAGFFIGPPAFAQGFRENKPNEGNVHVYKAFSQVGVQFLDCRPLTEDLVSKAFRPDGIHFTQKGARAWGGRIFHALQKGKAGRMGRQDAISTAVQAVGAGWVLLKLVEWLSKPGRR